MSKLIIVFAALVAVCHGSAVVTSNGQATLYYLYTRDNPNQPITLLPTPVSISGAGIVARQGTVILVHGHSGSGFTSLNPIVKEALLTAADLNVIVVDWSIYSGLSYSVAVGTVPTVADELVTFIDELLDATGGLVTLANLHLVGFNLGAHVVGITGRNLPGIARITGLDPSGSQWGSSSARLRVTDAAYVEVIHTDGNGILANGLGTAIGRVDFFANGGSNQPGCFSHTCCHERAFELFAASMINPSLVGFPCASNLQLTLNTCRGFPLKMGGTELTKLGSGIYRVNTGRSFPF